MLHWFHQCHNREDLFHPRVAVHLHQVLGKRKGLFHPRVVAHLHQVAEHKMDQLRV